MSRWLEQAFRGPKTQFCVIDSTDDTDDEDGYCAYHGPREAATDLLAHSQWMPDEQMVKALHALGLKDSYEDPKVPGLTHPITLWPAQLKAIRFALYKPMHRKDEVNGALLALDMGLGKTLVALCCILVYRHAKPNLGPAIVVCPKTVCRQWASEAYKFFGASFRIVFGEGWDRWFTSSSSAAALFDVRAPCCTRTLSEQCDVFILSWTGLRACWAHDVGDLESEDAYASEGGPSASPTSAMLERCGALDEFVGRTLTWVVRLKTTDCKRLVPLTKAKRALAKKLEWESVTSGTRHDHAIPVWTRAASAMLGPIMATEWGVMVLDESHTIRNSKTETFKSSRFLQVGSSNLCCSAF